MKPQSPKKRTPAKRVVSARVRSTPPTASSDAPRVDVVDAARGLAVAAMIAYHVCFDLTYFGWADWAMLDDARWIAWRSTIVASFLLLVGVSLALREARNSDARWLDRDFVRRWAQIALAALLVSAGSAALFPATFIYFGVLHFVAAALWICRRAPRHPMRSLVVAAIVLAVGLAIREPAFDPKWIDWIGFAAAKPATEDYVPLVPWLAIVLVGCALGGLWARRGFQLSPALRRAWDASPAALPRTLAFAGRWSLAIYLVHQPLLIGTMALIKRTLGP